MEPIIIISGKCSPGKTMLTALFASRVENKVIADCDVGAPDLHRHLLLKPGSPGNA
jgi:MinD superfamily P-loop ATPase